MFPPGLLAWTAVHCFHSGHDLWVFILPPLLLPAGYKFGFEGVETLKKREILVNGD